MCKAGISLGGILCIIEFALIAYNGVKSNQNSLEKLPLFAVKIIVLAGLLTPTIYKELVYLIISVPADSAASIVSKYYTEDFKEALRLMLKSMSETTSSPVNFLSAVLYGSILVNVATAGAFLAGAVGMIVTTIVQQAVFLYLFLLGPIMVPFSICRITAPFFQHWLAAIFTSAWVGFIGSVVFLAMTKWSVVTTMSAAGTASNVILGLVYAIVTLALSTLAYPVTGMLFGEAGTFSRFNNVTGPLKSVAKGANALAGAGAGAMVAYGAANKGIGSALSKYTNNTGLAKAFSKRGDSAIDKGQSVFNASQPKSTDNTARTGSKIKTDKATPNKGGDNG